MTLRIPDDEVARPTLATTPDGGVPALDLGRPGEGGEPSELPAAGEDCGVPLVPQRIISVGPLSDDTLELPAVDFEARGRSLGEPASGRAPGIDAEHEAGWTPYQPAVSERADVPERADLTAGKVAAALVPRAPSSEEIPVDTDEEDDEPERVTYPRLAVTLDSEELRADDGERSTDPGEEVAPEDLVSVEAIAGSHAPPLVRGGKNTPSAPPVAPSSGSSVTGAGAQVPAGLVQNAPFEPFEMPAAVQAPGMGGSMTGAIAATSSAAGAVVARRPSVPAPHVPSYVPALVQASVVPASTAAQPAASPSQPPPGPPVDEPAPAAGTPMARRQQPAGGPFGFMPLGGGLAPPPMNEAAANRKKTRPWWEDLFNDDFIRTMAKVSDADIAREANFIEESLGCEAGATILDLACGTGRHAVELASRGYQVVGFDLSLSMLARASDEAQERDQKINFVQGDMREMTFEETFDGVFSWNTSFGFFDEEKNAAVIAKVHRALKKGGQFLLDVVNRDNLIRSAPSLAWFEGDGCICMDEMQVDFITSRMKVKRTLMMDDGRTKEIEYSIRVYSLHELGKMLHDNGFRVAEVSGRTGTPGVFFGCESPRALILAEKR
jgi:SAM-dependent methyltransferase